MFLTLTNQKQELPLAAIFVGGTERNGETLLRTLHRCLLPSLVPFGQVVSEEKIKIWKKLTHERRTPAHNSDSPLLRQPITPTAHYSDGPFFRQCKIELNPQIHGLTRCIQQDVPSVRLILTDHGLDRMFWKGKGAFILGCTSPFKAIMIDRPGMGKVKNWRKSCAHCTKEPEKRNEGKKCKPGEARERQNDGR